MNVMLEKSKIQGRIEIPVSKSNAHRVMIASFLAGKEFDFGLKGDDLVATKNCLSSLKQLLDGETDQAVLDAGESGSTFRFLLPIVCALGANAKFVGRGRLPERPIGELLDVLKAHGANIIGDKLPLTVISHCELCIANSGLQAGIYKINAGVSSQYITGLLFALPLLQCDSKIVLDGELVSKNYVDLTIDTLEKFGVEIERADYGFFVKGNQKYVSNGSVDMEGDWSSAAFPLALGLLCGDVSVVGLDINSAQADRVFFDISKKMGGDICFESGVLRAKKSSLIGRDFDATNCPDIVPIISVLCAFADGKSKIVGVDRLRAKESDRLKATQDLLIALGVKTEYAENALTIYGNAQLLANKENRQKSLIFVDSFDDHRIAMSGIVAGLAVGDMEVGNVECISKSYPIFIQDILPLGANIKQNPGGNDGI